MAKPLPPTPKELIDAIDDLYYAANQVALFVYWSLIKTTVAEEITKIQHRDALDYISNGVLESSLLLIRKTTEFFKPHENNDKADDLRAYHYLPEESGVWLVDRETLYTELHKRVGHITVSEARRGKMKWPIVDMTLRCVEKWIWFFSKLPSSPVFTHTVPHEELKRMVRSLEEVRDGCLQWKANQVPI